MDECVSPAFLEEETGCLPVLGLPSQITTHWAAENTVCYRAVLEARSVRSGGCQGHAPSELLLGALDPWPSLAAFAFL